MEANIGTHLDKLEELNRHPIADFFFNSIAPKNVAIF